MSDSYTSVADVKGLVANVNNTAKNFEAAAGGDVHLARRTLQLEARKLLYSLEEPNTEVWPRVYQVNVGAAIEVVSKLGLWSKFEGEKTISLAQIVQETKADEIMIIRIFRQLTAAGILEEIPGAGYALTTIGQPYLNSDHRAFNDLIFNDIIPAIMAMPRTLAERGYKAPTKESGTPYKWANGEELWTWLGSHPDRAMNMGMSPATPTLPHPFGSEVAKLNLKDDDVAIVDIAGGQGHIMEEVRERNPNIKGRFIVQDLPSTFAAVSGPPAGVEFMEYDIFTPQPVKNASIYYYRHIFHDWSDGDCTTFLEQVVPLLKEQPESKLLLVDLVLPDTNATMQEAIQGISMFPIGGLERTETQWSKLLAKSGLKIKKIWRGSEPEACVECELL
ncbi:hypothetical protein HYALB_00013320 [Hymenoscyphus albidus]|uniref:O-methyltransferase C-terminal domain-containing protein n=1 Tax=Hymenoscyphus albidus TaxID=595503 RepID=A0A9N9Q5X5_9HELO|nr:hypothetical protein HYALB_00013320 [Hymenoscyphus albidus]